MLFFDDFRFHPGYVRIQRVRIRWNAPLLISATSILSVRAPQELGKWPAAGRMTLGSCASHAAWRCAATLQLGGAVRLSRQSIISQQLSRACLDALKPPTHERAGEDLHLLVRLANQHRGRIWGGGCSKHDGDGMHASAIHNLAPSLPPPGRATHRSRPRRRGGKTCSSGCGGCWSRGLRYQKPSARARHQLHLETSRDT